MTASRKADGNRRVLRIKRSQINPDFSLELGPRGRENRARDAVANFAQKVSACLVRKRPLDMSLVKKAAASMVRLLAEACD